ncbi:pilus assembly FimT family protein [Fimbriiglobus ruber]|uniref:Prepilin-type N-terminal cleavage/methylation domain-containing protein n=1 Tax=Fimbriiglobus ruber TaxID=1908690 RepID=A0A225DQN4_9BACT|nr:prepilin-type N-terminal cleavage/methylation domain-containing protein [Fimbriiglobus ruber]OWK43611.1 hypothetical protein FRUB_03210 [Fimbriiglobus ruber]
MSPSSIHRTTGRAGFTLIELLVAVAIMIALAGLTVAAMNSGAFESQKIIGAADRVSTALLISKQRALRDGAPRGVRFLFNAANPTLVTEYQYIEYPDQWTPNPTANPAGPHLVFVYQTSGTTISSRDVYFVGSTADLANLQAQNFTGQGSEYLNLPDFGSYFQIIGMSSQNINFGGSSVTAIRILLSSYPDLGSAGSPTAAPPTATYVTDNFAFQLAAQPILGEPVQLMPSGAAINVQPNTTGVPQTSLHINALSPPPTAASFDICFIPAGQVLGCSTSLICLWVHDPSLTGGASPRTFGGSDNTSFNNAGQQSLIAIYTRTGAIATQPVTAPGNTAPANYDPWSFAKDGINAGF